MNTPKNLRKVSLFEAEKLFLMKVTFKHSKNQLKLLLSAENYGEAKDLTENYFVENPIKKDWVSNITGNAINYNFGLRIKTDE
jgi:hypothetical protein